MQVDGNILLLFDLDGPEAFDPFLSFGTGSVVVTFVRIGLGDPEGEEREWEEFECLSSGCGVRDGGKEGIL